MEEPFLKAKFSYIKQVGQTSTTIHTITPAQLHAVLTTRHKKRTKQLREMVSRALQRDGGFRKVNEVNRTFDFVMPFGVVEPTTDYYNKRPYTPVTHSGLGTVLYHHNYLPVPDLNLLRQALLRDTVFSPSIINLFSDPSGRHLNIVVALDHRVPHITLFVLEAYLRIRYPAWSSYLLRCAGDGPLHVGYAPDAYLNPHHKTIIPFPLEAGLPLLHPSTSASVIRHLKAKGIS